MVFCFRVMVFTQFLHHLCKQSFKLLYSGSKDSLYRWCDYHTINSKTNETERMK